MKHDDLIISCVESAVKRYGPFLDALVLVGSFARGEAIVRKLPDGSEIIVSDVELLVVVKKGNFPLKIDLPIHGGVEITISQTTKEQLKKLRPTILAVELKKFGKVLWGKLNILDYIPPYKEQDIDPVDAFVLLNNRIVEQLKLRLKIESGRSIESYLFDKGYVQIVNSILAFRRNYRCLYPEKYKAFRAIEDPENVYLTTQVKEAFENCFKGKSEPLLTQNCLKLWGKLREAMKRTWLWEAGYLLRIPSLTFKQAIENFPNVISKMDRAKGWAKLIKQKKLSILGVGALTNILSISPQFMVYQEAVSLYFGDSFDKGKFERVVEKWEKIVK